MSFKSSKVSHPSPFLFQFQRLLPAIPLLAFSLVAAGPEKICLYEPRYDSTLLSALDRMYRADYAGSDSLLRAKLPAGAAAQAYFRGLVLVNRFNDLGDSAALSQAARLWQDVAARDAKDSLAALYAGLSDLQLSYVASLRGHAVRAATLASRANGKLKALAGFAEADAALALYDYYKAVLLKGVAWIPFVKADVDGPLRRLEAAVPKSRYLREVLQTSLLWLYYDDGRYDEGLARIDAFLARYPANRLGRQMQADFHFRKKDFARTGEIQESLKAEYARLESALPPGAPGSASRSPTLPLGYLSAVGNLAKVYDALNQPDLKQKNLSEWSTPEYRKVLPWLPASLRREVKAIAK
jgi:hypothetical protein